MRVGGNQIAMAEVRVDIGDQKLIVKTDGGLRRRGFKAGKDITVLRVIPNGDRQDKRQASTAAPKCCMASIL
ncbi:hypothetical protein SODG_005496 [Sodalis praecaptivus]